MPFGQLVIGPPGAGKTTYCAGVAAHLASLGRRVALVNLDPANDVLPYKPALDVSDLVCLEHVTEQLGLGPNGGMLYCMEYLAANLDWLAERVTPLAQANTYLVIDCPGQVELFTQQAAFRAVLDAFGSQWHYRLAAVHLVDAHLATDAAKYISALLLSLSTMLHLELPQVNVLSKVDLLRQYGELAFNLDYYTQVQDLTYLVASMSAGPFSQRFRALSQALCEVVEGFGLVGFTPLAIQDRGSLERLVALVDSANGAAYASLDGPPLPVPAELLAAAAHRAADDDIAAALQEAYLGDHPQRPQPWLGSAAPAAAAADAGGHRSSNSSSSSSSSRAPEKQQQQQPLLGPLIERQPASPMAPSQAQRQPSQQF